MRIIQPKRSYCVNNIRQLLRPIRQGMRRSFFDLSAARPRDDILPEHMGYIAASNSGTMRQNNSLVEAETVTVGYNNGGSLYSIR